MNTTEAIKGLVGIHSFTAYRGDIERDKDGNILNEVVYTSPKYKNLIVDTGKNLALDRLFNLSAATAITSIGVGDVATAAAVGQTRLIGTTNVLVKNADAGTARVAQTVTIKATFGTAEANFTWNEGGLFNGNVNGTSTMFNRVVIGPFAKTSQISIIYETTITQS